MRIEGSHGIKAPRDAVWEALLDLEVLSRTVPGCERLERVGELKYEGEMSVRIGPVEGKFRGTLELSDLEPGSGYRFSLNGNGPAGFFEGQGSVRLEEGRSDESGFEEAPPTQLHYELEAQVGGRIASVGQRLLDSSAKVITRQSLERLNEQIVAGLASDGPGGAVEAAGSPSQRFSVTRFVREVAKETIVKERRPILVVGAVLVAVIILTPALRACGS